MSRVTTYLNFSRSTEEAFNFYKSVFGGEFNGPIHRLSEAPTEEGAPEISEQDKNLIMHIELPILGGHVLMGTDVPESMGAKVVGQGNNIYINLEPDTKKEAEKLFKGLSEGGIIETPLQEMFWGAYYGACRDKYGIQWMINCAGR